MDAPSSFQAEEARFTSPNILGAIRFASVSSQCTWYNGPKVFQDVYNGTHPHPMAQELRPLLTNNINPSHWDSVLREAFSSSGQSALRGEETWVRASLLSRAEAGDSFRADEYPSSNKRIPNLQHVILCMLIVDRLIFACMNDPPSPSFRPHYEATPPLDGEFTDLDAAIYASNYNTIELVQDVLALFQHSSDGVEGPVNPVGLCLQYGAACSDRARSIIKCRSLGVAFALALLLEPPSVHNRQLDLAKRL